MAQRTKSVAMPNGGIGDLSGNAAVHNHLGLFEFHTLLTPQAREISVHMIDSAHEYYESKGGTVKSSLKGEGLGLDFDLFRTWLDLNSFVRTMFYEALNPLMWAIDPTGKPLRKHLSNKGT